MKNKLMTLICIFALSLTMAGCSSIKSDTIYGSGSWHQQKLEELTTALASGEITKETFEMLKADADKNHFMWRAGARRGVRVRP